MRLARSREAVDTSDLAHAQTAAGSKLIHLGQVDDGVYKGSKPKTDADYRFLQSLHVKYIIDLHVLPFVYRLEQKKAKHYRNHADTGSDERLAVVAIGEAR